MRVQTIFYRRDSLFGCSLSNGCPWRAQRRERGRSVTSRQSSTDCCQVGNHPTREPEVNPKHSKWQWLKEHDTRFWLVYLRHGWDFERLQSVPWRWHAVLNRHSVLRRSVSHLTQPHATQGQVFRELCCLIKLHIQPILLINYQMVTWFSRSFLRSCSFR